VGDKTPWRTKPEHPPGLPGSREGRCAPGGSPGWSLRSRSLPGGGRGAPEGSPWKIAALPKRFQIVQSKTHRGPPPCSPTWPRTPDRKRPSFLAVLESRTPPESSIGCKPTEGMHTAVTGSSPMTERSTLLPRARAVPGSIPGGGAQKYRTVIV